MVAGADDSASQIEDRVEVYDPGGGNARDDAQLIENDRDRSSDEQLEEIFHPEVNDPEAPGINHRKIAGAAVKEGGQIKNWYRQCRAQEQQRKLASLGIFER